MTDPEDLRHAIGLVCLLKGWNRKQFAVAARLHRVSVSRIEHGGRTPSTRSEAAIGDAAGLSPETWRDLVAVVGRARREIADGPQTFPKSEKGGDPLAELAAKTIARLGEALETLLSNPASRVSQPEMSDPAQAAEAWERLQRQPKETHRALIEEAPEFQTSAFAERLGAESEAAPPGDAERYRDLAYLVRRTAEPGPATIRHRERPEHQ